MSVEIQTRRYVRGQVTRLFNDRESFPNKSQTECMAIHSKLVSYSDKLNNLNSIIQKSLYGDEGSEDELMLELESCDEYSDKLNACFAVLQLLDSKPKCTDSENARSMLKSPVVPLPVFTSTESENVEAFLIEFETAIAPYSYTERDKLLLLKQQVSGRASILLRNLEFSKQTYNDAKILLKEALASRSLQKFNAIKQMSEMKLEYGTDPFSYIGKITNVTDTFSSLNIGVEDVLQYFIWHGMNDSFKGQLVNVTNNMRPTLKEIKDNFFEASERYMEVTRKFNERRQGGKSSTSLAVNVKYEDNDNRIDSANVAFPIKDRTGSAHVFSPMKGCALCKDKHATHKCEKYKEPEHKLKRLEELNGCKKCANIGHPTEKCKFRFFKKCYICKGWHFSFLCSNQSEQSTGEKRPKASSGKDNKANKSKHKETSSDVMVITKALHTSDGASVLPTFTCEMLDGIIVRGLKDCGCQTSFVTEKLACENQLKVLEDNVSLTVNGFNSSKKYKSKLVEVPCKFDDKVSIIHALCVPSIDIDLSLPGISEVARAFAKKGFKLADKYLTDGCDKINGIDLILGTNDAHCLLDFSVQFGNDHPSVYLGSSAGVMLMGNIKTMQHNLPYLSKDLSCYPGVRPICSASEGNEDTGDTKDLHDCKYIGFASSSLSEPSSASCGSSLEIQANFAILNDKGMVEESELRRATDEMLRCVYEKSICEPEHEDEELISDCNENLIKFVLDNGKRNEEGRLEMPLLWNEKCCHLLGKNFNLAKAVLKTNTKKLQRNKANLELIDENFREQEKLGIIERIPNLERYMNEHPECSFLAHMGIFKLDRETTKCRVVFLSNVCENSKSNRMTVNHNQAMYAGPSLNQKITSAMLHLRFGSRVLIYDIKKAFNQIALSELDQQKLLFLWYKSVKKGDFSIIAYKNVRLPFGLRCSPTILMLALYKILVLESKMDKPKLREAKWIMYQLLYMDNGGFTCESSETLCWVYGILQDIFGPYKIELQQMFSNDAALQDAIDEDCRQKDVECKKSDMEVKLLGMNWNRESDTISTRKLCLNEAATTKREILRSIAANYDVFNINGPLLNRARLFMQDLQCERTLGWDAHLRDFQLKEWKNIANQLNSAPIVEIPRCVGERTDDYKLEAYVDASKRVYGVVLYLYNKRSGTRNFVLAKNRLIGSKLHEKSIPSLELQAICLGTEVLLDTCNELSGTQCLVPINIVDLELFSDSFVALSWLKSFSCKFDKMQKRSVFVMNKLNRIAKLCEGKSVKFSFVSGLDNPADKITRCLSYKRLMKSNYHNGPVVHDYDQVSRGDILEFQLPMCEASETIEAYSASTSIKTASQTKLEPEHLIPLDRFSTMDKLISVHAKVLECWDRWKRVINKSQGLSKVDFRSEALTQIISRDQQIHFSDVLDYLSSDSKIKKGMPNIVSQLNLYPDTHNLIRVHCKFDEKRRVTNQTYPILLSRESTLTKLIIMDGHLRLKHAGCYALLAELRKKFWIPKFFSTVKRALKECIICKRFHERPVQLSQSAYREFRLSPSERPFGNVFLDYCGPFYVRQRKEKVKVWILVISCMFTRAVNLKVCVDMTVEEFLRAFSLHSFEYGVPQFIVSDLGTQIVAGANIIQDFLKGAETIQYLIDNNVEKIQFQQYYKGCSQLGGLVESVVKMTKHLIQKSIKNNVMEFRDFEYLVCHAVHLINRRPIAFKEALRDCNTNVPIPITPEELIHGYSLISLNIIPALQDDPDSDEEFQVDGDVVHKIKTSYERLKKVRSNLLKIYHQEFLNTLITQATDKKDRYVPVNHKEICVGDIVLIKDAGSKPVNYPMGVVKEVFMNINGEVTAAKVMKGKTNEITKRHVTSLIPLLRRESDDYDDVEPEETPKADVSRKRPTRGAAEISQLKSKSILNDDVSD